MGSVLKKSTAALSQLVFLASAVCYLGCGGALNDPNSTSGETPESRGRRIVDEYLKRDAAPYRKSRIRFTVTEESEPPKVYEIDSFRKQTPDETTTMTEIVSAPQGEDGARSLTIEAKGKKTVVITHAASRDEFRETDSKKMFFGGLTVGELLGDWDKFSYQALGEKELNGIKVFEVDGRLKAGSDSIVSRMDMFFRSDNYVPVESHLFGADGKEIRTYRTAAINNDPVHPYASRVDVDNIIYKAHIIIEILSQEYPAAIDDAMFAREKLKEPVRK